MLPLRDKNPSGTLPALVYSLIAANVVVFVAEVGMSPERLMAFVQQYGLVPSHVTDALRGEAPLVSALILPMFASMFLHGGWLHLIGNMWFLHIFGDNVEDRLGHAMFLVLYLASGVAAASMQYFIAPESDVPVIGASGAIAGVLGAYVVRWPNARVVTMLPMLIVIELPAVLVLGLWFLLQFVQGAASLGVQFTHGVAYWAHVGGFVTGAVLMVVMMLIHPARKQRSSDYE